jgi:hypothetical protein
MHKILIALTLAAACSAEPTTSSVIAPVVEPMSSCGSFCNSSWDCNADPLKRCRFCYRFSCSESLPAGEPGDAGTDSPKGTP